MESDHTYKAIQDFIHIEWLLLGQNTTVPLKIFGYSLDHPAERSDGATPCLRLRPI